MKNILLLVVLVAAFAVPAAHAENSTSVGGYAGQTKVQSEISKQNGTATQGGNLPFTGADLGLLVVGGAVFVLVGLGMRRAGRNRV